MPLGTTVTSYVANLFPNDPIAPQVVGDFAQALPPNPIRGQLVSDFADSVIPTDPLHSSDVGSLLSDMIQILVQPDTTSGGDLFF
jgi:hypothetical protein